MGLVAPSSDRRREGLDALRGAALARGNERRPRPVCGDRTAEPPPRSDGGPGAIAPDSAPAGRRLRRHDRRVRRLPRSITAVSWPPVAGRRGRGATAPRALAGRPRRRSPALGPLQVLSRLVAVGRWRACRRGRASRQVEPLDRRAARVDRDLLVGQRRSSDRRRAGPPQDAFNNGVRAPDTGRPRAHRRSGPRTTAATVAAPI